MQPISIEVTRLAVEDGLDTGARFAGTLTRSKEGRRGPHV